MNAAIVAAHFEVGAFAVSADNNDDPSANNRLRLVGSIPAPRRPALAVNATGGDDEEEEEDDDEVNLPLPLLHHTVPPPPPPPPAHLLVTAPLGLSVGSVAPSHAARSAGALADSAPHACSAPLHRPIQNNAPPPPPQQVWVLVILTICY